MAATTLWGLLFTIVALTSTFAQETICGTIDDVFINVGGSHLSGNYRCDAAGPWASSNVIPYQIPRAVMTSATGCKKQYERMVWAATGDIVYTIPVPAGTYTVTLMFLEPISGFHGGSDRVFTAKVGDTLLSAGGSENLNIETLAGGLDKPYIISTTVSPIAGNIVVTIGRVTRNPFLSGIAIQGTAGAVASGILGNTGINTCEAPPSPLPASSSPSAPATPGPQVGVKCPTAGGIFINAGGIQTTDDYRCDVPGLWTGALAAFTQNRPVVSDDTCVNHLQTHRYAGAGDLEYNIPVPAGSFDVDLQFMENYPPNVAGMRKFTINVDGQAQTANGDPNFDIFSLAGGLDKPYVVSVPVTKAAPSNIKIIIGRVAGMDNPFIGGIAITGTNADSVVGASGIGSCTAAVANSVAPTVTPVASVAPSPSAGETPTDVCGEAGDLFINAGGENIAGGYRCEAAGSWAGSNTNSYFRPTGLTSATGCVDQYLTSSWAGTGDLVYTIPLPAGTHTVNLMFFDPVDTHVVGSRVFNIKVGATADFLMVDGSTDYDIVQLAGGAEKPYVVTTTVTTAGEALVITIARIPGKQNPMLSAIGIKGADGSVGSLGLTSCETSVLSPTVTAVPTPSAAIVTPIALPGVAVCPAPGNIYINAGGLSTSDGYRCDVPGLWRTSTHKYDAQRPIISTETTCISQYSSQASLFGSEDLIYNIPVPAGTFEVSLMFMENWAPHTATSRLFTITVNGKAVNAPGGGLEFDIWTLAGGTDKPYIVTTIIAHTGGDVNINIGRTPNDNPMLSGIVISGPGADTLIGDAGVGTCDVAASPVPSASATVAAVPTPSASTPADAVVTPTPASNVAACPATGDVFINAGGENLPTGFRCDAAGGYFSTNSDTFAINREQDTLVSGCLDQYKTSRFATSGNLVYTIPVPFGTYSVSLMFTEPIASFTTGLRVFTITVGGETLQFDGSPNFDIFKLSGGQDKPYVVTTTTEPVSGNIVITFGKVVQNPTINAIGIKAIGATSADGTVGAAGLTSCVV